MKPFILVQHEKDRAALKELRESEAQMISGGTFSFKAPPLDDGGGGGGVIKLNTLTVTPNSDGGDDGQDEG